MSLASRRDAEASCEMGLAGAGRAEEDNIASFGEGRAGAQLGERGAKDTAVGVRS